MKPAVLESPFAGNVRLHKRYISACLRDALLNHDESPYMSHRMLTEAFDDTVAEERQLGIQAGYVFIEHVQNSVFYLDCGMSKGMKYAEGYCKSHEVPVSYRFVPGWRVSRWDAFWDWVAMKWAAFRKVVGL